jgi:hypothetical protein
MEFRLAVFHSVTPEEELFKLRRAPLPRGFSVSPIISSDNSKQLLFQNLPQDFAPIPFGSAMMAFTASLSTPRRTLPGHLPTG